MEYVIKVTRRDLSNHHRKLQYDKCGADGK